MLFNNKFVSKQFIFILFNCISWPTSRFITSIFKSSEKCFNATKTNETLVHTLTLAIPKSRVLTRLLDLMEELLTYWSKEKILLSTSKLVYHEERTYLGPYHDHQPMKIVHTWTKCNLDVKFLDFICSN